MSISTIESTPITSESMPTTVWRPHRWTTAEFDALLAGGYLREGSKTFVWDGEIVDPMPENESHANAQDNLYDLIKPFLPTDGWTVWPAHPVALKEGYKPQPDLVILLGPRADYRRHTPTAANVALIIEIADTSYTVDGGEKLAEYASAGIPGYWIVNIAARRIEVYREPARQALRDSRRLSPSRGSLVDPHAWRDPSRIWSDSGVGRSS